MSKTNLVIEALEKFCTANSGEAIGHTWHGKSGTYQWNLGRETGDGIVNGVVRKLAGVDATGHQIWVVAGSLKILPSGEIVRFTGLSKKNWQEIHAMATETVKELDAVV